MRDSRRTLVWMALFLALVAGVCALVLPALRRAFEANVVFNGLIVGVAAGGIVVNVAQVLRLGPAARWLDRAGGGLRTGRPPRLLAPLARVLGGREREGPRMSALTMRSLLDGVRLRLDESRDVSRYLVGLLIFLGLLGTFWGLLDTVGGVARVIGGLGGAPGDSAALVRSLQQDLQQPLSGMATAFSSSLFGLAGALVLGVLDLQTGQAQGRFYSRLEEWLAGLARLASGAGGDGEGLYPPYVEALLEQTAENLAQVQRVLARSEEVRRAEQTTMVSLSERLAELTDQLRAEQRLLVGLARRQSDLQPAMSELATQVSRGLAAQEEAQKHLRNVDLSIARLLEEVSGAREEVPEALRQEVRVLAQTLGRRAHAGS